MTQVKMPDPVAKVHVGNPVRYEHIDAWALDIGAHYLITTTQAEVYADARVREALEEAAKICWEMQSSPEFGKDYKDHWLAISENRIRSMIKE